LLADIEAQGFFKLQHKHTACRECFTYHITVKSGDQVKPLPQWTANGYATDYWQIYAGSRKTCPPFVMKLSMAAEERAKCLRQGSGWPWASILAMIIVTAAGCRGSAGPWACLPRPRAQTNRAPSAKVVLDSDRHHKNRGRDLHVDLAARNDTGDWSSMAATGERARADGQGRQEKPRATRSR